MEESYFEIGLHLHYGSKHRLKTYQSSAFPQGTPIVLEVYLDQTD